MAEERNGKQSEDYQFINEKIVPKRKTKWMKRAGAVLFTTFLAVIFGVVARAAFLLSDDFLRQWLGEEEQRQEVALTKPTTQARITMTSTPKPVKTTTPVPTLSSGSENATEPTVGLVPTPQLTPEEQTPDLTEHPTVEGTDTGTESPEDRTGTESGEEAAWTEGMSAYLQIYESVRSVAQKLSPSLVTVVAIEQGVDWFQEVYEKRAQTTGLILGNDGVDLLILVGTEQFTGATSIEVSIGEEVVDGQIYSMDKEYGLAVVAVSLNKLSEELLAQVQLGVLADPEEIQIGTPVVALGAPNGYEASVELGMITSLGSTIPVTDGEAAYFTTNIMEYPNGHGYVVTMEGKVLGLITHAHKNNVSDGVFSAISLGSIRGILVKLLNNAERAWFGIKGQDIPKSLAKEYGLTTGVYVSEVENASPALAAGIKAGDILLRIGDEPIEGLRNFTDKILECSSRETVLVTLLRNTEDGSKEVAVEVILGEKK